VTAQHTADVAIVGAGPVGLSLAMDLASRGLTVLIVETRRFAEPPNVKCNHVSSRTMEQFRRLGVAAALRSAGLPEDYPNDVVFRTGGPDGWWPTPEPPHRINQVYLEPILLRHAAARPGVTLLNRCRFDRFEQDRAGVRIVADDLDRGDRLTITARYLVGCDGGASAVRKQIGARLEGTPVIQRVQSTYIRAPQLRALWPGKPAWCCYSVNPRRCGTAFAIDGEQTWLVHNHLNPDEPEFDSVDRDWSIRQILGVDEQFEYDVITREDWVGRRMVATRFRDRNVFIAGDAAHLWVPYAGYGMNAGIADALNLSWLLAAQLEGWADEAILDAYESERQPITEQVSQFAMDHAQKMIRARRAVPPDIEADDAHGAAVRKLIGDEAYELNVQQFCCAGLNYGYFYAGSPIICADGESAPPYTMGDFTPSTVPGCRAPHFWLADGRSLYDTLGPAYTLLVFDRAAEDAALCRAAHAAGVPMQRVDLSAEPDRPTSYRHRLVLCRTDQHVVWRADTVPADCTVLIDRLRGAGRDRRSDPGVDAAAR
jgi:2-polyprenyl-6-methoxyphenol hydroxylase-like FAD-dependent oxidoreductase